MKRILFIIPVVLLMFACNSGSQPSNGSGNGASADSEKVDLKNLTSVSFNVEGMTCEGCENSVEKACKKINGVAEASASHTEKITTVQYDSSLTTVDQIREAIQKSGYEVTGLADDAKATADTLITL